MQHGDQGQQIADRPRCGQGEVANVVFQVEAVVGDPEGLAEPILQPAIERHLHVGEATRLGHHFTHIIRPGILGYRKQLQAPHMHGLMAPFQMQEYLIDRVEQLHGGSWWAALAGSARLEHETSACTMAAHRPVRRYGSG